MQISIKRKQSDKGLVGIATIKHKIGEHTLTIHGYKIIKSKFDSRLIVKPPSAPSGGSYLNILSFGEEFDQVIESEILNKFNNPPKEVKKKS